MAQKPNLAESKVVQVRHNRIKVWSLICAMTVVLAISFPTWVSSFSNNMASILLVKGVNWAQPGAHTWQERLSAYTPQDYAYLRAAHARWPTNRRLQENLAKMLWFDGKVSQAVAEWQSLAQTGPVSPVAWFFLGWGYERMDRPDAAVAAWRRSGVHGEAFLDLYWQVRVQKPYSAEALRLADIMVELEPDSPKFLMIGAEQNEMSGQRERSAALWNRAAALLPVTEPNHWWALGQARKNEHRWEDAAAVFAQGRQLDPDNREFWKSESYVFIVAGQWQAAAGVISGWAARFPQDKEAYTLGARMLSNQCDNVQARQWLETAITEQPDYALAYYNLGLVYYALGDREQAIRMVQQAISLESQGCPYAWYSQLGAWYREQGLTAETRVAYESALTCRPDYAQARQALLELSGSR